MQFSSGFRLGDYEVIAPIGVGGMGEVYRARDTRLDRDVALKVIRGDAGSDPDHRRRFESEARAVAALSHPNILAIYNFGIEGDVSYAAMELLEGRTLRQEIATGPLSVRRTVDLGSQMARGLAAAHDKGIVHGDLKPENVFVLPDGRVKLLDFGLARMVPVSVRPRSGDTTDHATQTAMFQTPPMLMGSIGYMSPEQIGGLPSDHRADIFSLGVVLFEMLTLQSPFRTEPAAALQAVRDDAPPSIADVRTGVPVALDRIVMRCLEKSPADRFQSASDLAFALAAIGATTERIPFPAPPSRRAKFLRRAIAAAVAIISLVSGAVAGHFYGTAVVRPSPMVTFTVEAPSETSLAGVPAKMLALSPIGDRIVFAVERDGQRELWVRPLESANAMMLPGTQNATDPFWSPDGQYIGFFADSTLKRLRTDGSAPSVLCNAPLETRGATWNQEGTIVFADAEGGLSRVRASGGSPERVTMPDRKNGQEVDSWPEFLPDGRRFMYLRQAGPGTPSGGKAYIGTLDGGDARQILSGVFNVQFVQPDLVLFADGRSIKIQRLDLDREQLVGDVEDVVADVDRHLGHASMSVARNGTFAYAAAGLPESRLVWVDRRGHEVGQLASRDGWRDIVLSPDASQLAVQRIVPGANDIWTIDIARGVPSRFTLSPEPDDDPVWSPDGRAIAFSSVRNGAPGIYLRAMENGERDDRALLTTHSTVHPTSWSPDGRFLLFDQTDPVTAADVWILPALGEHTPRLFLRSKFYEGDAHFSPDGRWVAYTSDESGRDEVYVASFPDAREQIQVSTNGGACARWARSGRELYFLSAQSSLMVVSITLGSRPLIGVPMQLFGAAVGLGTNRYAPSHDGQRFLLSLGPPRDLAAPLVVVLNWSEHLAARRRP